MRGRVAVLGALLVVAAACRRGDEGPTRKLAPVRFVTGAGNIPVTLGIRKGFFAERGIDLRLVVIAGGGGVEAVVAAAAGEVDVGSYGSPVLVGAAAGVPIKIVASPPAPGQHFVLVARRGYERLEQLEGKRISPGRPGQGTLQAFRRIAGAHGLLPSDFEAVDVGNSASAFAALQAGSVEAVIASEASGVKAELEGFGKVIERAADYFGRYQHSFVFATQRFVDRQPEVLRAFLAAYRRSVEYVKAHPEEAIQLGVKVLELEEAPLRAVLTKEIPTWDPSGRVDLEGTDAALRILKELGEIDPSVPVTAAQLVDERFLAP